MLYTDIINDGMPTGEPTPLYVSAERRLDEIRESLMNRLKTIDGEVANLDAERLLVNRALARITPPEPSRVPPCKQTEGA